MCFFCDVPRKYAQLDLHKVQTFQKREEKGVDAQKEAAAAGREGKYSDIWQKNRKGVIEHQWSLLPKHTQAHINEQEAFSEFSLLLFLAHFMVI